LFYILAFVFVVSGHEDNVLIPLRALVQSPIDEIMVAGEISRQQQYIGFRSLKAMEVLVIVVQMEVTPTCNG